MKLSFVIVTHNRRGPLMRTLAHLATTTPLQAEDWEAWVVDNASTDGTVDAVTKQFPWVKVLVRPTNEGVWARSCAFEPAEGEYLILLDDDSYPINDAVTRSIAHLDRNPTCAAVVGKVLLPDGSEEGCALPSVMLSGAVCLRKSVLAKVGGFRPEFFRKAGEYDLSYRIWQAGFSVDRFEDVVYRHDKVVTGRSKPFAHRMDLRNNLILIERYLPSHLRRIYRTDITQRYSALARQDGCERAAMQARIEGKIWRLREAMSGRQTLSDEVVESIYQIKAQERAVGEWVETHNIKRVVIADFSKNLYATYNACRKAGVEIVAIGDSNAAFRGLTYRGVPVVSLEPSLRRAPTGVIVSNINPAQCRLRADRVRSLFRGPVLTLWRPQYTNANDPQNESACIAA